MPNPGLLSGLAGFWPLTEATGTRAAAFGGADLLEVGGATEDTPFSPNNNATQNTIAANFNDTGLAVSDNTLLRFGTGNFSLSCWVRLNTLSIFSSSEAFVAKAFNEANGFEYLLGWVPGFGFIFNHYPAGTVTAKQIIMPGTVTPTVGRWYFLCARRTPTAIEFSIDNGEWAIKATSGGFASSAARFSVGDRVSSAGVGQTPSRAAICNVGVWSRALSDADRGDLYNSGLGLTYDFDYPVAI